MLIPLVVVTAFWLHCCQLSSPPSVSDDGGLLFMLWNINTRRVFFFSIAHSGMGKEGRRKHRVFPSEKLPLGSSQRCYH